MISAEQVRRLAEDWVAAWNDHDLDRILAHYAEGVEFTSPFAVRLLADPDGTVRGKEALGAYFGRALAAYPELRFELKQVLVGVASITVYYTSVGGLWAAEVMHLDDDGKVMKAYAHYAA